MGRRTPEDIREEAARIERHIRVNGSARAETLAEMFRCTARYLEKPLKLLLREKRITKAGAKRWTEYAIRREAPAIMGPSPR